MTYAATSCPRVEVGSKRPKAMVCDDIVSQIGRNQGQQQMSVEVGWIAMLTLDGR
jgi:hypothetical protein